MNNILQGHEIEAEIYYLTESEGGRKTPIGNGYRGQFYYNGRDWDAPQEFIDKELCKPGESVKVKMQTLSPEYHIGHLSVGQKFEIREGAKTVGKGEITKILRPDFVYWDTALVLKGLAPSIEPYSGDDLVGFKIDFDILLGGIDEIEEIEIIETGEPNCMLKVICKFCGKTQTPRIVFDKIVNCWKDELAINNQLFKIDIDTKMIGNHPSGNEFRLSFVTWNLIYLTGQIIAKT